MVSEGASRQAALTHNRCASASHRTARVNAASDFSGAVRFPYETGKRLAFSEIINESSND
jgi:hypothetical protein